MPKELLSGALDRSALTAVVRQLVRSPDAVVDELTVERLWGMGYVGSVHRIEGTARCGDESRRWTVIRKHVADTGSGHDDLRYWRREPLVYSCGLLDDIRGASAPRCFAQVEDAEGIELWLEDVATTNDVWRSSDWERAAVALARMAAPFACGQPVPEHPWLSRGWLETWVDQATAAFAEFDEAVRDPWLAPLFPPAVAAVARSLWSERHAVYARLRAGAPVLGHLDAVPVNIRLSPDRVVLLDWAFTGHAALGEDLACLVGAGALFGGPPASQLAGVDKMVFAAYVEALRESGWDDDSDSVRFAYCASAALRYCLGISAFFITGFAPPGEVVDVGGLRSASQRTFFEGAFGRPLDEIIGSIAANFEFLTLTLGTEALQLLTES